MGVKETLPVVRLATEVAEWARERPRLKAGVELRRFESRRGTAYAIAREPGSGAYLRLSGDAGALAGLLDGDRTIAQLEATGWDPASVQHLLTSLDAGGLLDHGPEQPAGAASAVPSRRPGAATLISWLRAPTISLPRADAATRAIYRRGGRLAVTPAAAVMAVPLVIGGLIAFTRTWGDDGLSLGAHLPVGSTAALMVLLLLGKVLHELGHALAVQRADRHVIDAGLQLYLGLPAFYVDSTDLLLASRRARIVNALAGPCFEAVVASTASLAVAGWPDGPGRLVLFQLAAISWVSVVLNLVPFLELDGYWLLTDVLETPRLRSRAFAVLRHEVPGRLARRRGALAGHERALAAFGLVSALATIAAIGLAVAFWWLLADAPTIALWRSGLAGRGLIAVAALVVASPGLIALAETADRFELHQPRWPHRPRRKQPWQTSP